MRKTGLDFKTLFILIWSLHSFSYCYAELRDPTKPVFYSVKVTDTGSNQTDFLKLSSIWISGLSKRATINGVTARQGEHVFSDIKIIKISNNSVLIEQNGNRKKLFLLTRSYKTL